MKFVWTKLSTNWTTNTHQCYQTASLWEKFPLHPCSTLTVLYISRTGEWILSFIIEFNSHMHINSFCPFKIVAKNTVNLLNIIYVQAKNTLILWCISHLILHVKYVWNWIICDYIWNYHFTYDVGTFSQIKCLIHMWMCK